MNANEKPTDVAPAGAWFKSSYSSGAEGNCVEVAVLPGRVGIRDSKQAQGPALLVLPATFSDFARFAAACQV
ncbi:DUF397 domain-containing protein [Streptomyces sp. NPDC055992]|uniref:DUF397 domain-containing protein n=1 Tax=Streptomyces sp. NPDC055992 TaxID=3345673 RepID=UPI0035DF58F2